MLISLGEILIQKRHKRFFIDNLKHLALGDENGIHLPLLCVVAGTRLSILYNFKFALVLLASDVSRLIGDWRLVDPHVAQHLCKQHHLSGPEMLFSV